jgi:hypothetical protein
MWNSFTNVDPSVATTQFPNHKLSIPRGEDATATEILQKMYGVLNVKSNNDPDSQKPGS